MLQIYVTFCNIVVSHEFSVFAFSGQPLRAGLSATPLRSGPAGSLPLVGLASIPAAASTARIPMIHPVTADATQTLHQPAAGHAARLSGRAARQPPPNPHPAPGRRFAPSLPCSAGFWAPYLRPKPHYAASAPPLHAAPALSPPHRHKSCVRHPRHCSNARPRHHGPAVPGLKQAPHRASASPD